MAMPLALILAMPFALNLHCHALGSDLALILNKYPGYRSDPTLTLALTLL
jgi:hypothetical protein